MLLFKTRTNLEIKLKISVIHWVCCIKTWWSAVMMIMQRGWSSRSFSRVPTSSLLKRWSTWITAACEVEGEGCGRTRRNPFPSDLQVLHDRFKINNLAGQYLSLADLLKETSCEKTLIDEKFRLLCCLSKALNPIDSQRKVPHVYVW